MLRRRQAWASRVTAGAAFVELTRNDRTKTWHPHLHLLIVGDPIDQRLLSHEWYAVTGDSYIVDIRLARGQQEVIHYVCAYTSKASPASIWQERATALEYISATKGLRLYQCFGAWAKRDLEPDTDDAPDDWQYVGRLDALLRAAARQDPHAFRTIWALARKSHRTADLALQPYLSPTADTSRAIAR